MITDKELLIEFKLVIEEMTNDNSQRNTKGIDCCIIWYFARNAFTAISIGVNLQLWTCILIFFNSQKKFRYVIVHNFVVFMSWFSQNNVPKVSCYAVTLNSFDLPCAVSLALRQRPCGVALNTLVDLINWPGKPQVLLLIFKWSIIKKVFLLYFY